MSKKVKVNKDDWYGVRVLHEVIDNIIDHDSYYDDDLGYTIIRMMEKGLFGNKYSRYAVMDCVGCTILEYEKDVWNHTPMYRFSYINERIVRDNCVYNV